MPVITSLEAERRSGGVRLEVDGKPLATVGVSDVSALSLRRGAVIEQDAVDEVLRRADTFAARTVALRILAARSLPTRELTLRLVRRGHVPAAAAEAVEGLVSAGLVNDEEFARNFARTRVARRKLGPVRLSRELQRFGIRSGEAETVVAEAFAAEGVDLHAVIREAAQRKLRSLEGREPAAIRRGLRAFLRRRGFPPSDVAAVLRELPVA